MFGRLQRQVVITADSALVALYGELRAYPCDQPEPDVELPGTGDVVVPLRHRHDGGELSFFSIVAAFGTPLDITVAELAIESFFPSNPETAARLRALTPAGHGTQSVRPLWPDDARTVVKWCPDA